MVTKEWIHVGKFSLALLSLYINVMVFGYVLGTTLSINAAVIGCGLGFGCHIAAVFRSGILDGGEGITHHTFG